MAGVFETDEHAYRACILYEVMRNRSVKNAFKRMKKVKPNVEYSDFAYWYHRFSNGHRDLKHDKSTDSKPRGLSDMPTHVTEKIVGYLNLVEMLSARKVCRQLRTVIDNQTSEFGDVKLSITEKSCEITYEDLGIKYSAVKNGNYRLRTPKKSITSKGDYSVIALREFASVITHRKWSFEEVAIWASGDSENEQKSILFLNSLLSNHQIHVEHLSFFGHTYAPAATLLPRFKADSLEFDIDFSSDDTRENLFEVIVEMEQWKNAAEISIDSLSNEFPIEVLFRATGEIKVGHFELTKDRIVKIRDILFKAPAFKSFTFCDREYDDWEELAALIDNVMGAHPAYNPRTKIYRIDSSYYIQITFVSHFIEGGRKNALRIQRIRN